MLKVHTREVLYERYRTEKLLAKRATRTIGPEETKRLLEGELHSVCSPGGKCVLMHPSRSRFVAYISVPPPELFVLAYQLLFGVSLARYALFDNWYITFSIVCHSPLCDTCVQLV